MDFPVSIDHQAPSAERATTIGAAGPELRLVFCRGPRGLTMRWVFADSNQPLAETQLAACPVVPFKQRNPEPYLGYESTQAAAD
jgi:hypothetical protein